MINSKINTQGRPKKDPLWFIVMFLPKINSFEYNFADLKAIHVYIIFFTYRISSNNF